MSNKFKKTLSFLILGSLIFNFSMPKVKAESYLKESFIQKNVELPSLGDYNQSEKLVAREYILGANDIISINFLGVPELSKEVRIQPDGKISVSYMEDFHVAGKTISEVQELINQIYDEYLENSKVRSCLVKNETASKGFYLDVIMGHSWGPVSFTKDVFPKAKLIAYIEWFYNSHNSDIDFIKEPDIDTLAKTRYKNSHILVDLYTCDKVITPTEWQLQQIPEEFRSKAEIVHEGIDTEYFKPDENAIFEFEGKKFTRNDEVITYATRGMEPYRGFPQFMEAASVIQKRRPNAHILIAGEDRV